MDGDGAVLSADGNSMFRAALMRIISGSQLVAAVFAGCIALVATNTDDKTSCALCAATCMVAFYHYVKLVQIRERGTRLKRADQVELEADAVRLSDWAITLTPLILDLHMLVLGRTNAFSVGVSALLCVLMVALGAWVRLGLDDLYATPLSTHPRFFISGILAFGASCGCLVAVLNNLLGNMDQDPSDGWAALFSLPWIGYGATALISIVGRQSSREEYPGWLSVFKDLVLGVLDIWSKASFAVYIGLKAMGKSNVLFTF